MKALCNSVALMLLGSILLADDPYPVGNQTKQSERIPDKLPLVPSLEEPTRKPISSPYPSPIPMAPFDMGTGGSKTPTPSSLPKGLAHFHSNEQRPPWDIEPPAAVQAPGACNFDPVGDKLTFSPDFWSYQFLIRGWNSQTLSDTSGRTGLVEGVFRMGYMLTAPSLEEHLLRGNWEAICEFSLGRVHEGSGKTTFGFLPAMRYNFVSLNPIFPSVATLPYLQLGGGIFFNDIYKDREQNKLGQALEFQIQASVGSRWFLSPAWTLDFELSYRYLNNFNLATRSEGLNLFGFGIGATYSFPAGTR
ncbi:MAG: acyloxyacyl hydrolase [Gemmataceae bacterium]|nr:acyloxyacyl hydrolase [Gemmataceae bacterium]